MSDIKIKVGDKSNTEHELTVPTDLGLSLLDILKSNGIIVTETCGGIAECAVCHVFIKSDHELKEIDIIEDLMLDEVPTRCENSRLSCQIGIRESMNGLEIQLPK